MILTAAAGLLLTPAAHAYVEVSDAELRELEAGHKTLPFGPDLKGGEVYFVDGFSSNNASYYLYLPSAYSPTSALPSLVFMNAARSGLGALLKWLPSAEDLGWILVCPHDLGNNAPANSRLQVRDILTHFRTQVAQDTRRLYTGGISGGSCRAYALARSFRGEFAGLVDVVGWMCDYDEYTYYPKRLAVVHLNGELARQPDFDRDDELLHATGVRTTRIDYLGGHIYPSLALMDQALRWLDQDFAEHGATWAPAGAEQEARELLDITRAMLAAKDDSGALPLLLEILHQYAFTLSALDAESLLVDLLERRPAPGWVDPSQWDDETRTEYARMLFQRALYYDEQAPLRLRLSLGGLAATLDPTTHHTLDVYADALIRQSGLSRADHLTALELSRRALQQGPGYWMGYLHAGNEHLVRGEYKLAGLLFEAARKPAAAWYDPFRYNLKELNERTNRVGLLSGQNQPVPLFESFMRWPAGYVQSGPHPGWFTPAGAPLVVERADAAGRRALQLTGPNDAVRLNIQPATGATLCVSFMLWPTRGTSAPWPALYPDNPIAFRIDADGQVAVRHAGLEPATWTTLQHDPLPEDTWCRITFVLDLKQSVMQVLVNHTKAEPTLPLPPTLHTLDYVAVESWSTTPALLDTIHVSPAGPLDDLDNDTLPDEWELETGLEVVLIIGPRPADPARGPNGDPDQDGLINLLEWQLGTHPLKADTDGDRMNDGAEYVHGFNPLVPDTYGTIRLPASNTFARALADDWTMATGLHHRINQRAGQPDRVEIMPSLGDGRLTRFYAAGPKTVIWISLTLQPTPGTVDTFTEAMQQGAALLFLDTNGFLNVFNGHREARRWMTLDQRRFPLDQSLEIRLRLDYRDKTWSVWYGSQLLADQLGFANPDKADFSAIAFEGTGFLESFSVAAQGPSEDGDEIPDDWERRYFGDLGKATQTTDSDGDGFPDESEYRAGTDPTDPGSLLEIVGAKVDGQRLHLTWQAKSGNYEGNPITYNLLRSRRLTDGVMPPVACEIVPDGAQCTYTIEGDPAHVAEFYSVEANP